VSKAPQPAYRATKGGALDVDRGFYDRIATAPGRRLVDQVTVPIRAGRAWEVRAGQVCRIVAVEGAQVGDFNCWNLHNSQERFWAARTRQLQAAHITTYDRLWSCLPYLRPMLTITGDSVGYGVDEYGGRCHDLLGTRCDPYVNRLLTGVDFDYHCHSNLVRAVLPHGLTEADVHDVLNVFQVTGLVDDRYYMNPSPARKEDYLEFFAEIDLLCALSSCPGGDLSVDLWGPESADPLSTCRPLGIEVYDLGPTLLDTWTAPRSPEYRGMHGLACPDFTAWDELQK
jgi:uncharacterized protein YcgI (DUF1989 family)